MKLYIGLRQLVRTTAYRESIINYARICCRTKPVSYKLKYSPEDLIQKQSEYQGCFGASLDKQCAINYILHGDKYDRIIRDKIPSILEDSGDYVLEDDAGLLLEVEADYDLNDHFIVVKRVDSAKLLSIYPDVAQEFRFSPEKLNWRLKNIHISYVVSDQLIECVHQNDIESLRELLTQPLYSGSLNLLRYPMKFPANIKRDYPMIYHQFRDNSIMTSSMSNIIDEQNTNEEAPILFQAIMNQDSSLVELLLQHGASTKIRCNGCTPHQLAEALGNSHIISVLEGSAYASSSQGAGLRK